MFVRDLLWSSLKRWYLLLFCLALVAVGSYQTYRTIPPTYQANASVVLLPPDAVISKGDNPYLYLGGLDEALGVLQVTMNSKTVAGPVQKPYPGTEFEVTKDLGASGPIMQVTTTGTNEEDVLQLLKAVLAAMPGTLVKLQSQLDITGHSRITAMVLAQDKRATASYKTSIRALVVVGGGGAAGSLLLVGWLDRLLLAHNARRADLADSVPKASRDDPQGRRERMGRSRVPSGVTDAGSAELDDGGSFGEVNGASEVTVAR